VTAGNPVGAGRGLGGGVERAASSFSEQTQRAQRNEFKSGKKMKLLASFGIFRWLLNHRDLHSLD
jgi:hypothetical protein